MRVVGVDLGSRRVGVAVSDPAGVLASPYEVLARTRDLPADRRKLAAIVAEVEAGMAAVGEELRR